MSTCRTETCCPAVSTYRADADPRSNVPGGECPIAQVTIFPPDGSHVIIPTFITLSSAVAGAAIYYTVDGTEPTEDSTLYTGPFELTDQYATVKARAILDGCDPGPVSQATYPVIEDSTWQFAYLCETGDKVGVFDEFAANGQANDYQFTLLMDLGVDFELANITILQTDSEGVWVSGQSWSTKEWIHPFADSTVPFHTYPLVLIDQSGPTQLFTDYQESLGTVAAGSHEWRMWGQPFTTLNGYFLCQITLGNGTVIRRLIEAVCTDPPPPCPAPGAPALVAACTPRVTVSFTAGANYKLYRRSADCGDGNWAEITSGIAGAVSYPDDAVTGCCNYDYYVEELCDGNYVAGAVASVLVPCECEITVEASDTNICNGESVTIEFEGLHCVGAISYGTGGEGGSFTDTGVLAGSIEVAPTVTTTYTFRGASASCGNFYASVTITVVECPPECPFLVPTQVQVGYPQTLAAMCFEDNGGTASAPPNSGLLNQSVFGGVNCRWTGTLSTGDLYDDESFYGVLLILQGGEWKLVITGYQGSDVDTTEVWRGRKTYGDSPYGVYTRQSGFCGSGPATVTVSEV